MKRSRLGCCSAPKKADIHEQYWSSHGGYIGAECTTRFVPFLRGADGDLRLCGPWRYVVLYVAKTVRSVSHGGPVFVLHGSLPPEVIFSFDSDSPACLLLLVVLLQSSTSREVSFLAACWCGAVCFMKGWLAGWLAV